MSTVTREQLAADLRTVISDADTLLKETAGNAGAHLDGVRERLAQSLKTARARVATAEEAMVAQSKAAAKATDQYVHENPWPSIGVATAVGVLLGILMGRR